MVTRDKKLAIPPHPSVRSLVDVASRAHMSSQLG
jgi:hypothetical protein